MFFYYNTVWNILSPWWESQSLGVAGEGLGLAIWLMVSFALGISCEVNRGYKLDAGSAIL